MSRSVLIAVLLVLGPLAAPGFAAPEGSAKPAAGTADFDAKAQLAALTALRAELRKSGDLVAPLLERRNTLSAAADRLAAAIDAEKRRPDGVRRDLDLQKLLADSKRTTDELERVQAELRWRTAALTELRRRLVHAVDVVLDHDGRDGTRLPEALRLELERARTSAVAALATPVAPLQIAGGDPKAMARTIDPLDGPRELHDKADLLRDSGDKLRREAQRLALRIDSVDRRRRLRERVSSIDEDTFTETASNRRVARASSGGSDTVNGQPNTPATLSPAGPPSAVSPQTPPSNFGNAGPPPSAQVASGNVSAHSDSTILRNLVDPETLDELRSADAIDDIERQTHALKKAQSELESLAAELDRRAKALEGRADSLKRHK
jgi:hypothetical protein